MLYKTEACEGEQTVSGKFLCHRRGRRKKKKQSLEETLKDHFPEGKESWHNASFNTKEHFTKHMKGY